MGGGGGVFSCGNIVLSSAGQLELEIIPSISIYYYICMYLY